VPRDDSTGTVFDHLQDRSIRVSWKTELRAELGAYLSWAQRSRTTLADCDAVHRRILQGRVFVALHMHAGDGNVAHQHSP